MTNSSPPQIPQDVLSGFKPDCSILAEWYSQIGIDIPLRLTANLLRSGYSNYWNSKNLSHLNNRQILDAYLMFDDNAMTTFNMTLQDLIDGDCRSEVCPRLGWQGNPDLAGRGMLVNYCIEAVLTTLYFVVFVPNRLNSGWLGNLVQWSRWPDAIAAFRSSSRTFLDAASMFSISMLIATIYILGDAYDAKHPQKTEYPTFYNVGTSFLMTLWSLFPVYLLYSSSTHHLRRQKFRKYVWALVPVCTLAMIGLFIGFYIKPPKIYYTENLSGDDISVTSRQYLFEDTCLKRGEQDDFYIACFVAAGATVMVHLVWFLLLLGVKWSSSFRNIKLVKRIHDNWWLITATLCFIAMWSGLGVFIYYRKQFSGSKMSGGSDKDHEWGFGQILTLVTFMPVLIDWAYSLLEGPEKGLTSLLPKSYSVVCDSIQGDGSQTELIKYKRVEPRTET